MTETQEQTLPGIATSASGTGSTRRGGGLSGMLLPQLQELAGSLGISTAKKRKSDLVAEIQAVRAGGGSPQAEPPAVAHNERAGAAKSRAAARSQAPVTAVAQDGEATVTARPADAAPADQQRAREQDGAGTHNGATAERPTAERSAGNAGRNAAQREGQQRDGQPRDGQQRDGRGRNANGSGNARNGGHGGGQNGAGQAGGNNANGAQSGGQGGSNAAQNSGPDDDDGGRRRGRRYRDRRGRNRERQPGQSGGESEPTIAEDDVLIPVAGILDCVEDKNTWFIRTAGYYASPDDIYVANSYVRRFGLRRGDAVTGEIRQLREGERREKYNPLVRLDTVNGRDPEQSRSRVEFTKLTPLYPQERLRLETEPHILTTRVIDLVMPIGKGQRALIVSPPKAGKTMIMQAIANAIALNNPECHLMVVLVDERPEEVTDMQRSVKGEVIASTFDRRPLDHTMVAELAIERAKRLVELGHDVVVLLDSITRLGRAYNLAAPASGRILSGGVDSTALYQPKRFLGAARNIENGGSLTIIASALVETGSAGDTVFFEEYKGTGNAELKLDRKIADKRVFPAVDVDQSSTRKEEILLSPDELAVTVQLRRVLHALEPQQAIDLLLDRLRKTRTNVEFLMQIAKTTPSQD